MWDFVVKKEFMGFKNVIGVTRTLHWTITIWVIWGDFLMSLKTWTLDVEIDIGNIKKKESSGTKPKDAKD